MKKLMIISLLYAVFGLKPTFAANTTIIQDANGQKFLLNKPIKTIISLAPNITELVFSAGAGAKLIGVTERSDYPKIASKLPIIGSYNKLNLEKIKRLNPDIILVWKNGDYVKLTKQLRRLNLRFFVFKTNTLADIKHSIHLMGQLFNTQAIAKKQVNFFNNELTRLTKSINYQKTKPKVFIQIWHKPLITLNKNTIFSEVVRFCGGANIFAKASQIAPRISVESVLKNPPDLILISGRISAKQNSADIWRNFKATDKIPIFYINADYINRATMRTLKAIRQVCHIIQNHPSNL